MTDAISAPISNDSDTNSMLVVFWLLLAGCVLCFFLADGWMDTLLYGRRSGSAVGYISNANDEVELRPRSTLNWLDVYRHLNVESGDTVFVGPNSDVTLRLNDGMKLELGANSLAQISFGTHDTINVRLSAGSVQVEAPQSTHSKLRLDTGGATKILAGTQLRHTVISQTADQSLKVVEAPPRTKGPSRAAVVENIKPTVTDADLLNDFKLAMAPPARTVAAIAPPKPLFVGPPTPPASVLQANIKAEETPPPPPVPKMLPFGQISVDESKAIQFTDTPKQDAQALVHWQPIPQVHLWQVASKNTDTGEIRKMTTSKPGFVVNGENPGHYEYVVRGFDSKNKPVTKVSKMVSLDVRPPLFVPVVQSPIDDAMVVTYAANRKDYVMLRWQPVDTDQYELQIADNAKFNDAKSMKLTDSVYVMKVKKPVAKVYWRVRAVRDQDTSAWSSASFKMADAQ